MSISMVCGSLFLLPFAWPEMVLQDWTELSLGACLALAYSVVLGAVVMVGGVVLARFAPVKERRQGSQVSANARGTATGEACPAARS